MTVVSGLLLVLLGTLSDKFPSPLKESDLSHVALNWLFFHSQSPAGLSSLQGFLLGWITLLIVAVLVGDAPRSARLSNLTSLG